MAGIPNGTILQENSFTDTKPAGANKAKKIVITDSDGEIAKELLGKAGNIKTDTTGSSSIPLLTVSTEVEIPNISVTITPSSTTAKILLLAGVVVQSKNNATMAVHIKRGTHSVNTGFLHNVGSEFINQTIAIIGVDSPGSTSAQTYKLFGQTSDTTNANYFQSGGFDTSLTAIEIS